MEAIGLSTIDERNTLEFLDSIQTAEDIEDAIKQLDVLKELLKAADRFYEESIRYARLEARALVRIVEIGGEKEIKNATRRKAAIWLANHSVEERDKLIKKCEDGLTITQVWKREILDPEKRETIRKEAERLRKKAFDDYRKRGVVHLTDVVEYVEKNMKPDDARDFYEGTRGRLVRNGAIGLDDGEYTYCDPEKTTEGLDRAIEVRVHSLCNDIIKLSRLMDMAPYARDVRLNTNGSNEWEDTVYAILAALGKCSITFSCEKSRDRFIGNLSDALIKQSSVRGTVTEAKNKDKRILEVADNMGVTYEYARRQAAKEGII